MKNKILKMSNEKNQIEELQESKKALEKSIVEREALLQHKNISEQQHYRFTVLVQIQYLELENIELRIEIENLRNQVNKNKSEIDNINSFLVI